MSEIKVIDYTIDDTGLYGVSAVSVVDKPAIEMDFVALSKQDKKVFQSVQEGEKRMLYGPALIPEQLIYREEKDGTPFYIRYKKDVIEMISQEFLRLNRQNNATFMHEISVAGVSIVESWIVGNPDKSQQFGFNLPEGTWFIGMKVYNDAIWQKAKEGEIKGFSIEGYFMNLSESLIESSKAEKIIEEFLDELNNG
ncbi:Phage-like element PBSX protein, XkdF [uncultured Caudovirales phage]|uniref:Phage-like element PBSX protein, XkdF n=1 Tax=uncultured Caudovirales phage TaxID=2100421 RepID=A0A6J7X0S0_9CAUD|nr:Phage-like element PBSX protein, XkdF [uncultured Caudovirales phage]